MTPCTIPTSSGIYRIVCEANGKVYVGSAVNLRKRWAQHRRCLAAGTHRNRHLQNAWKKYGETAFRFEVAELVPRERLLEVEQSHIDKCENKFNIAVTAGSLLGMNHSEATRAKMSASAKGKTFTPETRARMSLAWHNRPDRDGVADRLRAVNMGRKSSPETRARQSAAHLGSKRDEKTKAKMRTGAARRWAAVRANGFSEETRAKMRESSARRWAAVRAATGASA